MEGRGAYLSLSLKKEVARTFHSLTTEREVKKG
jgi:hypothetical protein